MSRKGFNQEPCDSELMLITLYTSTTLIYIVIFCSKKHFVHQANRQHAANHVIKLNVTIHNQRRQPMVLKQVPIFLICRYPWQLNWHAGKALKTVCLIYSICKFFCLFFSKILFFPKFRIMLKIKLKGKTVTSFFLKFFKWWCNVNLG